VAGGHPARARGGDSVAVEAGTPRGTRLAQVLSRLKRTESGMQSLKKHVAKVVLVLLAGLGSAGCEAIQEAKDNFDSHVACQDYCAKKFDCDNKTPTSDDTSTCVANCRNSIEDKCGNDHQAAANDQISTCVDKGCADFWTCMVFDAAPECYGFVGA